MLPKADALVAALVLFRDWVDFAPYYYPDIAFRSFLGVDKRISEWFASMVLLAARKQCQVASLLLNQSGWLNIHYHYQQESPLGNDERRRRSITGEIFEHRAQMVAYVRKAHFQYFRPSARFLREPPPTAVIFTHSAQVPRN